MPAKKATTKPVVDPKEAFKNTLKAAPLMLTDAHIQKLEEAELLDPDVLTLASQADIQSAGIPVGIAIKIKTKYPTPVVTAEPEATSGKTSPLGGIEIVKELPDVEAPEGTTAVKKKMKLDNRLARQLGLSSQTQYYTGCSYCRHDLDEMAEEEGISVKDMDVCPYCNAIFVPEMKVHCYRCSTKMTDDGKCLKCQARQHDPLNQKIMTIFIRKEKNVHGDLAVGDTETAMKNAKLVAKTVATAKIEKWVDQVEAGTPPSQLDKTEGDSPTPQYGNRVTF